jgi:adenylate cyclase
MERDEVRLARLKGRRNKMLGPPVGQYLRHVFLSTGDGVLMEFDSAVNALSCAFEFDAAVAAANEGLESNQHIVLRIGIGRGDIIVETGDHCGDDANIAGPL